MMHCSDCGVQHAPSAKFCTGCGASVTDASGVSAQEAAAAQTNSVQHVVRATDPAAAAASPVERPHIVPDAAATSAPPHGSAADSYQGANPLGQMATWTHPPAVGPIGHPVMPGTPDFGDGEQAARSGAAAARSSIKMPGADSIDPKLLRTVGMGVGGLIALVVLVKILGAIASGGFGSVLMFLAFGAVAAVGFFAYGAHRQETREARTVASLPPSVQHVVAQMEAGAQAAFFNEYERFKKRTWVAYLLMWPLFGTHYFYLRQPLLNVVYWLTGGGVGLWALIDLFRMRSLVHAANEQTARQALQTLHIGATFANMPAPPTAMTQPVPPRPGSIQDR